MEKLKTGLVGCGRIGYLLEDDPLRGHPCSLAGAAAMTDSIELAAACDIDDERLRDFGERYGVERLYLNHEEMIEREKLDVLIIGSWTSTHVPIALAACRAGVAGILCEKPVATRIADARELVSECARRHVALVIDHERRFDFRFQQVRELIRGGAIGELRTIVGNVLCSRWPAGSWKGDAELAGGGPLLHDGTHLIDMMRFFAGDVEWVSAEADLRPESCAVEVAVSAMLKFENGAIGFIEAGGDRRYFNFELDVQCSGGRIRIGNGILEYQVAAPSRLYTGYSSLTPAALPPPPEEELAQGYLGAMRELVECVRTGRGSISGGEDGLAAMEIINAIYLSAARGGNRVRPAEAASEEGFRALISCGRL